MDILITLCVCCFVSERLMPPDKHPLKVITRGSQRSKNFEVSDKWLLLLTELPNFFDSKTQFYIIKNV
jgi:hypothetical protein